MQMRKNTLLLRRASYVDITSLSRGREVSTDWVFPFTITLLVVVNKCNAVDFGLLRHREYTRHIFTDELVLKKKHKTSLLFWIQNLCPKSKFYMKNDVLVAHLRKTCRSP